MKVALTLALVLAVQVLGTSATATISPALQRQLRSQGYADVFISMKNRVTPLVAQLGAKNFATRGERLNTVTRTLQAHAANSQRSLLAFLSTHPVEVKSYWINNRVFIKDCTVKMVELIAARSDVLEISENQRIELISPVTKSGIVSRSAEDELEWGLQKIEVQKMWDAGHNGTGIRVGGLDTGARHTHEALNSNFAKDYNWFDAVAKVSSPIDPHGHGTHITGTIAGSHNIGVAPGAEWVHCRGMNAYGSGTEQYFLDCAQWFTCPTLPDGSEPNCEKAPVLVSNSWGFYGGGNKFMDDAIRVWVAADIAPIFANGNEGPTCGHLRSPGDSVAPVIAVGSTDITDSISYFSSFGPSYAGQVKPDIAAPGSDVRSASGSSDTGYVYMSGTSMACPHAAGVYALIKGAEPNLKFKEIADILYKGATHTVLETGRNCGDIPESTYPNNHVGWGRLSASAYLQH